MMRETDKITTTDFKNAERALTPAARRALAEAEARRRDEGKDSTLQAIEINGRGGADPVRYGDWEVKGLASDF